MKGAGQWLEAFPGQRRGPVRVLFGRLGLVALCRPLSGGELDECLELGGVRGARYALWLACDSLREAGARRVLSGTSTVDFDITEDIPHADALAAGGIIARLSGAGPAMVRQLEEDEDEESALEAAWAPSGEAAAFDAGEGNSFVASAAFNEDFDGAWMSAGGEVEDMDGRTPPRPGGKLRSSFDDLHPFGANCRAVLLGGDLKGAVGGGMPAMQGAGTFNGDFDGDWMAEAAFNAGLAGDGADAQWAALHGAADAAVFNDDLDGAGMQDGGAMWRSPPTKGAEVMGSAGALSAQADALAAVLAERLRDAAGNMD